MLAVVAELYQTSQQAHNWVATPESRAAMDNIRATVTPLEFVGGPGDVVLAHGLIVHSAGLQQSGTQIRRAVIQDFNKVRNRGPLRWSAAGKDGGKGSGVTKEGLFVFPTDDPDVTCNPADGEREVQSHCLIPPHLWLICGFFVLSFVVMLLLLCFG